jgi:hypothetical protein
MNAIKNYVNSLLKSTLSKKTLLFFSLICVIIFLIKKYSNTINLYLVLLIFFTLIIQQLLLQKNYYILFLVRTFLFVLILFELICGLLIQNDPIKSLKQVKNDDTNFEQNKIMGYISQANLNSFRCIKSIGKDTIYNVLYSSDKYSRRISENIKTNKSTEKHALFLGCSITFGEGIPYESTFPYLFEKTNPTYNSYNYGFSGYGPHQMALLFSKGINTINTRTILEKNGILLYSYINDHLNRVYGGSSYLSYGSKSPDVYIENNNLVVKKRNKYHLYLARFINQSNTLSYFNIALTYPQTEHFYNRFAAIINYTASEYKKSFPTGVFYVSLYPSQNKQDTAWIQFLHKDIKIIKVNLPHDFKSNKNKYIIRPKIDNHPLGALNIYYTKKINDCIKVHQ